MVEDYLRRDPASMGWAAIIEWINHRTAQKADYARRDTRFSKPRKRTPDAE